MDITAYLNQGDVWITSEAEEIKISDMPNGHREYAARWLMQNSTGFILVSEAKANEDAVNGDGHVKNVLKLMASSPRDWMSRTPLYRALSKGL